jgi:hypothetical protein
MKLLIKYYLCQPRNLDNRYSVSCLEITKKPLIMQKYYSKAKLIKELIRLLLLYYYRIYLKDNLVSFVIISTYCHHKVNLDAIHALDNLISLKNIYSNMLLDKLKSNRYTKK